MNDKAFRTLQAQFALKGHTLGYFLGTKEDDTGARVTYIVSRWGMFRTFTTLDAVRAFLKVIGGAE